MLYAEASDGESAADRYAEISLHVLPGFELPISSSSELFSAGVSAKAQGEISLSWIPAFFGSVGASYGFFATNAASSISIIAAEIGVGYSFGFLPRFTAKAFASGGGYISLWNDGRNQPRGGAASVSVGAQVDFAISSIFSLGIGAAYSGYLGLYHGVSLYVDSSLYVNRRDKQGTPAHFNEKAKAQSGAVTGGIN